MPMHRSGDGVLLTVRLFLFDLWMHLILGQPHISFSVLHCACNQSINRQWYHSADSLRKLAWPKLVGVHHTHQPTNTSIHSSSSSSSLLAAAWVSKNVCLTYLLLHSLCTILTNISDSLTRKARKPLTIPITTTATPIATAITMSLVVSTKNKSTAMSPASHGTSSREINANVTFKWRISMSISASLNY